MEANKTSVSQPQQLTRQQLKDLERKELTPVQRFFELIIMILPLACGLIAIAEYLLIPDKGRNANPGVYLVCLIILVVAYNVVGWYTAWRRVKGDKTPYEKLRYKAPLFAALFLAVLAAVPTLLTSGLHAQVPFAASSILIGVSVSLEFIRTIQGEMSIRGIEMDMENGGFM